MSERKQLEELRSNLVGALHTQPFTIYSDETIEDLLKARPTTIEELTKVKGFPADGKRVKCFGKAIIAIFKGEVSPAAPQQTEELKEMNVFDDKKGKSVSKTSLLAAAAAAVLTFQMFGHQAYGAALTMQERKAQTTIEMNEFLETSKSQSKEDWEEKMNKAVTDSLKAEDQYLQSLEDKVTEYENKKLKTRKVAASKVRNRLSSAVQQSLDAAEEAEKVAEKLKRKAAKKQERARQAFQESLGDYDSYTVYNDKDGDSSVKSWMDYRSITSVTSDQYALQQEAYTGEHGIRMVDGRYCIAVGSHYASSIGTKIDVVLENGTVLQCILGDQKADKDTDSTHSYHVSDGSYVEFIVDKGVLEHSAKKSGNISSISGFEGKVVEIRVYGEES